MQIKTVIEIFCLALALVLSYNVMAFAKSTNKVTIYRDTWGVPHIYGETEESVFFAQGYAQAEDRLETVFKAFRKAEGTMAEIFGEDWIEHDYRQRLCGHAEVSKRRYNELDEQSQHNIEAFVAGIKKYMKENPDEVPAWAPDPKPYHVVALSRYVIWGWPLGQAMDDLNKAEPKLENGRGSNEWVLGRKLSAEDCVISLIDPHVGWQDEWLFYESHLHGGELDVFGFSLVGTPFIGLGHNDFISWTMTTGGPDTADVYEVKFDPENLTYQYDNETRKIESEKIELKVSTDKRDAYPTGVKTVEKVIQRTHHGPIVEVRENYAYVFKLAQADEVHLVDQMAKINKAKNLGEFLQAASMCQLMPQNLMYGDVYGNMYYVRHGRVPIRPSGYDWTKPVPGNTSATEWLGLHPAEDLVQILNPPAGFMQNCNISPGTMTFNSPMTAERYPEYIYRDSTDRSNSRGRRFMQIMRQRNGKKCTIEEALKLAMDTELHGVEPWQEAIKKAFEGHKKQFAHLRKPIKTLIDWNRCAEVDSVGMTLFRFWLTAGAKEYESAIEKENLPDETQLALLEAFDSAVKKLEATYGKIDVQWGEIHRAKRSTQSWGLAGVSHFGFTTLRAIGTHDSDDDGIFYARSGQSCPTIVLLKQPVHSFSVVPYGQSEKIDSPHFIDQGEKLMAHKKLKPTWYQKENLMEHLESEKQLKY